MPITAAFPTPADFDPRLGLGLLRGRGMELVKCRTIDLSVPANAEVVLEGYIEPVAAWEPAGVVAGPYGAYLVDSSAAILNVTAVTQRANPVIAACVLGRYSHEEYWIHQAVIRLLLPLLKLLVPEIIDCAVPRASSRTQILFVGIQKRRPGQARQVLSALWGVVPRLASKLIVVVDAHVNVHDADAVWHQVAANCHPGRDVILSEGPGCSFDHASPVAGLGRPLGIDATRKLAAENHSREWPAELETAAETVQLLTARWKEYGFQQP